MQTVRFKRRDAKALSLAQPLTALHRCQSDRTLAYDAHCPVARVHMPRVATALPLGQNHLDAFSICIIIISNSVHEYRIVLFGGYGNTLPRIDVITWAR